MYDALLKAISNTYAIGQAVFWLLAWAVSATSFMAVILSRFLSVLGDRRDNGFDFWLASMLGGITFTLLGCIGFMGNGGLSRFRAYALLLVMLAVGIRRVPKILTYAANLGRIYIREARSNPILGVTVTLLLLYPVIDLLLASLVSVRCGDTLAYHIWEPHNGIFHLTPVKFGQFYAQLPRNVETIYFFLRQISGDWPSANLFQALLFFTCLGTLARLFYQSFGKVLLACLLALTVVMSMLWLYLTVRILYIDAAVSCLVIISVMVLVHWLNNPEKHAAVVASGLAAGLAIGGKYIPAYYFVCLGVAALIFYLFVYRHDPRLLFKSILLFGAGCLLAGSYWYLRNWYVLGNPVYPFLFGHEGFTDAQMQELAQRVKVFAPKFDLLFYIFPLSDRTGLRATDSVLLPFYFTLGAFIFKKFRRESLFLTVFLLGMHFLVQGHSSLYPRYHSAFFALVAVLGAGFLGGMAVTRFPWLNRLASLVLVIICAVQISAFSHPRRDAMWGMKAFAPVAQNIFGNLNPQDIYCNEVWAAVAIKNMKGSENFRILYHSVSGQFQFFVRPIKIFRVNPQKVLDLESVEDYVKRQGYTHLAVGSLDSFSCFYAIRLNMNAFSRAFEVRQKLVNAATPVALDIPDGTVEFYEFKTDDDK